MKNVIMVILCLSCGFEGIQCVDVHVTSLEVLRLFQLERRLLTTFGRDVTLFDQARQELSILTPHSDGNLDAAILGNPLNVFYLYHHWESHSSLWPQLASASAELEDFLSQLPGHEDVLGVALHLLRLCDIFNLNISHVLAGDVMGLAAARPMSMQECFLVVDAAYQSFMSEEFRLWHSACQQMLPKSEEERNLQALHQSQMATRSKVMDRIGHGGSNLAHQTGGVLERLTQQMSATEGDQHNKSRSSSYNGGRKESDDQISGQMLSAYKELCQQSIVHSDSNLDHQCYVDFGQLLIAYVEIVSLQPLIVVFHHLLSQELMHEVMEAASPQLDVPKIVSSTSGKVSSAAGSRSGKVAFLEQAELLASASHTIKLLTGRVTGLKTEDEDSTEVLQVVNYGVGGHYEPHVDYFGSEIAKIDNNGKGDRVATMLFYLTDNVLGGATVFPFLGAYIRPTKGSAAFWFNTQRNGQGDLRTLHAGCPVVGGTKWIANLWIRQNAQVFARPCSLTRE